MKRYIIALTMFATLCCANVIADTAHKDEIWYDFHKRDDSYGNMLSIYNLIIKAANMDKPLSQAGYEDIRPHVIYCDTEKEVLDILGVKSLGKPNNATKYFGNYYVIMFYADDVKYFGFVVYKTSSYVIEGAINEKMFKNYEMPDSLKEKAELARRKEEEKRLNEFKSTLDINEYIANVNKIYIK